MNFQEEAMKNETLLPVGVRRDGSYYTRVLWADVTENDTTFWVNNLINDDLERNGGTWGANSETTANCVLDFFGETQKVKKISVYKNVGITISILEELAKYITVYSSVTDEPLKLRRKEDRIDDVEWTEVCRFDIVMEEGWQSIVLPEAVEAKYIRVELKENFCRHDESFIPWIETSEIKLYPEG